MVEPSPPPVGHAGPVLAAVCGVALVFAPLVGAEYVWDDGTLILENASLQSVRGLWTALSGGLWDHTPSANTPPLYYRPAMLWSLWIDQRLGGSPALAHLHSLGWHLATVGLVGAVVRRLGAAPWCAAVAAAAYGLHPVVVEPVAWVSARNDLMVVSLSLGVTWIALGGPARPRRRSLLGVAVLAGLAAASKETGYLLPVALLPVLAGARALRWSLPAAAAVGVALVVTGRWLAGVGWPAGADVDHLTASFGPTLAWGLSALGGTGVRVPGAHLAWPEPTAWGPVALTGGALALVVGMGRRLSLGLLGFAVVLVGPAWPAVAHVGLFGDRYLLAAVAGVAAAGGVALHAAADRIPPRALQAGAVLLLLGLGVSATRSVPAWRDDLTLWTLAAREHPNPHTAGSLAKVLETEGDLQGAATWYARATVGPTPLRHACWNVAALEVRRGDPAEAAVVGERALAAGCPPDAELVCPTVLGLVWTAQWAPAAARLSGQNGPDPTGLCTLSRLVLAARSAEWATLDAAVGPTTADRRALSAQVVRVLAASGDADSVAAVEAWASGSPVPPGG